MRAKAVTGFLAASVLAVSAAGCGEFVREQGRSPAQVVINRLQGASGAEPEKMGGAVLSDVQTLVKRTVGDTTVMIPTIFNDVGEVTASLILKNPGSDGTAAPSLINQVTFTRYRIEYKRSDGRNTPGIDVPFPFEGAATFTVTNQGSVAAGFELVRHVAKEEAPLLALRASPTIITTVASVTFYGRDQAGNDVVANGLIQIDFGNFADPE